MFLQRPSDVGRNHSALRRMMGRTLFCPNSLQSPFLLRKTYTSQVGILARENGCGQDLFPIRRKRIHRKNPVMFAVNPRKYFARSPQRPPNSAFTRLANDFLHRSICIASDSDCHVHPNRLMPENLTM